MGEETIVMEEFLDAFHTINRISRQKHEMQMLSKNEDIINYLRSLGKTVENMLKDIEKLIRTS
jgi:hypothetical protein